MTPPTKIRGVYGEHGVYSLFLMLFLLYGDTVNREYMLPPRSWISFVILWERPCWVSWDITSCSPQKIGSTDGTFEASSLTSAFGVGQNSEGKKQFKGFRTPIGWLSLKNLETRYYKASGYWGVIIYSVQMNIFQSKK